MQQGSGGRRARKWFDSAPASLCVLGAHLRARGFFQPLEQAVRIRQKVLKYTPAQKLELLFGSLLAGAKAVSHTGTTLRVDPALQAAFGRPGCADQSVLADTPDAATEPDVAARRRAVETLLGRYSHTRHHAFARAVLVLGLDLSPLPASPRAEGSERCCMGRRRSRTGRKLVRVRAAASQETVWEDVRSGRTVETLALLQQAVAAAERLPGLEGDSPAVAAKRARAERRLDSAWGSEADFHWLLGRGYQVTAEFRSTARAQKLVAPITAWQPTASAGREVAPGPAPVAFGRPTRQYAVRTPPPRSRAASTTRCCAPAARGRPCRRWWRLTTRGRGGRRTSKATSTGSAWR